MTDQTFPSCECLSLKEPTGWFAAGDSFRKALTLLPDGPFRLLAYLCLEADRPSGRFRATQKELAAALGKSKRAVGADVDELETKGFCRVMAGKNQFAKTVFEICDEYWPYRRTGGGIESPEQNAYVESVRDLFLSLGCGSGRFGAAEVATARGLRNRGIPLAVIEEAMLMGACRKYTSWFEGRALEPIQGLSYFEPLIAEIQEKPFPPGYSAYLRMKVRQFAEHWGQSAKTRETLQRGGYPSMPSPQIVQ